MPVERWSCPLRCAEWPDMRPSRAWKDPPITNAMEKRQAWTCSHYRTELDLNNKQVTLCKQHAGCARFAYNWGLACKQAVYQTTGRSISAMELHRELNALKLTDFPWMYECSKAAPQEALRDLDKAYQNFFRRCQLKKEGKRKGPLVPGGHAPHTLAPNKQGFSPLLARSRRA
jgi:hypothetical protein